MFEISDFYDYCDENDVDVIPDNKIPSEGMTVRDHGFYAVGVNMKKITSYRTFRTVIMHESGHLHTGALHKTFSPFQLVAQAEYKANACTFKMWLTPQAINEAYRLGYRETWQLADYFDIDEEYIKKALHYWTECKGVNF